MQMFCTYFLQIVIALVFYPQMLIFRPVFQRGVTFLVLRNTSFKTTPYVAQVGVERLKIFELSRCFSSKAEETPRSPVVPAKKETDLNVVPWVSCTSVFQKFGSL